MKNVSSYITMLVFWNVTHTHTMSSIIDFWYFLLNEVFEKYSV